MYDNVEAVTAGIDWITLTLPTDAVLADVWVEHCLQVIDNLVGDGYELKYRTIQGYYGVSAGNNFVGTRDDGHMVQLTGSHANDHFTSVYRHNAHVSRLDVQTTMKYKERVDDIAKRAYADAETGNNVLSVARRRKLLLLTGSDGGDTCYIGSASSEQRCRIYNKEVQSENVAYTRCWRYEVVYKNDYATRIANRIPYQMGERAQWAANLCYTWLKSRGVVINGLRDVDEIALPLVRTLPTDVERRLRWLKTQVIPTIKWLVEAGFAYDVWAMLEPTGVFRRDENERLAEPK